MRHLLLHQVFELCDLLCVVRVAGDVLLVKECLVTQKKRYIFNTFLKDIIIIIKEMLIVGLLLLLITVIIC